MLTSSGKELCNCKYDPWSCSASLVHVKVRLVSKKFVSLRCVFAFSTFTENNKTSAENRVSQKKPPQNQVL